MSKQNIHIAMGSLAYAIAKADNEIQPQEKALIKRLAQEEFDLSDVDNEWIDNMFRRLEKENISLEDAYEYAIDTLEANKYEFDFDQSVKDKCIKFMQRVAEAFKDVSNSESDIIKRFRKDVIDY